MSYPQHDIGCISNNQLLKMGKTESFREDDMGERNRLVQAEAGAGEKREGGNFPWCKRGRAERAAARLQVCNELSRSVNECVC